MRVLYLIGQGEGGLAHYTAELANEVSTHHDVRVLKPRTTDADGMFADSVEIREPFETIGVTMSKLYSGDTSVADFCTGVLSYRRLGTIDATDVDLVHDTTGLFPHLKLFAWYHDIDRQLPFVVTRHEVPDTRYSLSRPPVFLEEVLNTAIPDLDLTHEIAHTEAQREPLLDRGRDVDDVSVIPHGAYSVFGTHADLEGTPDRNTLLFFGNLVPPKGVGTLIRAIPRIRETIPDVTLVVAGDGSIPDGVTDIIEAHPENFEIHRRYIPNDAVKEFFGRASVVVLPYREQGGTKGHSGALSAAFSFGKPVVASTAGDFESLVGETGCGLVVPPDDPDALADAIVRVLSDETRRRQMAARSREMAERLSWESIADRHVALYRSLLADEPVEPPSEPLP